jgi:2-C-methyl-D-erythritol 4-phosphate cytidylyltransferase
MKTLAIILAGGSGERLKGPLPKQFIEIGGRPLLAVCLARFQAHPAVDGILLVVPAANMERGREVVARGGFAKVIGVLAGGATRQESSAIGVAAVPAETELVLIHDAARAMVPEGVIARVLAALADAPAVTPVIPAGDTTVRIDERGAVTAVLDRDKLRRGQTPQGFHLEIIRLAHEMARAEGFAGASDDCSLVLRYKLAPVITVDGDVGNIKITYPQDLVVADAIIRDS